MVMTYFVYQPQYKHYVGFFLYRSMDRFLRGFIPGHGHLHGLLVLLHGLAAVS